MSDLSYELAKGNLSMPVKEEKSKLFGHFLWGMDMLREKLEDLYDTQERKDEALQGIARMGEKELADLRLNEMGFIFQQMYMLKNLTVLDNIILPAVQSDKNTETRKEQ